MSKPVQKLSLKKIRDSANLLHEESGLVMKSALEKRTVVGRMEGGKILGVDKRTKDLCKEYASTYQFILENNEESSSEESSSEEEVPPSEKTSSEEEAPPKQTDSPVSIVIHPPEEDRRTTPIASSHIPPLNLDDSPTDIFKQFEDKVRAYSEIQREQIEKNRDILEQLKEEIAFNEDKKIKLVTQVETLEKQIRAIRSMLM